MKATQYYADGRTPSEREEVNLSHAVERGVGYGQLWFGSRWHLEFSKSDLARLAKDAAELAANL